MKTDSEDFQSVLEDSLLREIPVFENFLHNIGFKRNEGAVYGLLVLSNKALSSEEIEQTLHLSQSAVSQALKKLTHYGAVETREGRDPIGKKRVKKHSAKEDSLSIVSTVFKKREQETIEEFKRMAGRLLAHEAIMNGSEAKSTPRARRLKSILATCEIAESVMKFVIGLASIGHGAIYDDVVRNLPRVLEMITPEVDFLKSGKSSTGTAGLKDILTGSLKKKGSEFLQKALAEGLPRQGVDLNKTQTLFGDRNYDNKGN